MKDTLNQIEEAWESVLLEMDSKLESYAQKLPQDGMSADFLELLMFGVPSPELESFLQVLTAQERCDHCGCDTSSLCLFTLILHATGTYFAFLRKWNRPKP